MWTSRKHNPFSGNVRLDGHSPETSICLYKSACIRPILCNTKYWISLGALSMTILKILILNPIRWVIAVVTTVWAWFSAGPVRRLARRFLLIAVGAIVFVFGALFIATIAVLVSIVHRGREVKQIAAAIKPGMTIDQAVAVFPTGFWYANIGVPLRTSICKDAEAHIVPADEHPVWPFPDMAQDDTEGERLSWDARQLPLRLDRFELLDRHLRSRKDWEILVNVWTAYIQDKKDHAESESFLQRGTAYLQRYDFDDGYKDLRIACELGNKEGCTALAGLPKQKASAFDAAEQRAIANAPVCEAPVPSFHLQQSDIRDEFELQVYTPELTERPPSKPVSRAQLADLVKREFAGREWGADFTYQTGFPLRLTFSFVVERDGRIRSVSPVRGWD